MMLPNKMPCARLIHWPGQGVTRLSSPFLSTRLDWFYLTCRYLEVRSNYAMRSCTNATCRMQGERSD